MFNRCERENPEAHRTLPRRNQYLQINTSSIHLLFYNFRKSITIITQNFKKF